MSLIADAKAPADAKQEAQLHYAVRPYRLPAKIMHWTVASLVLFMVASGITMKQLGNGELTDFIFALHKTTGALILVLVVGRFCYRVLFPDRSWKTERYRRPFIHWLLYGLLLAVPLLGWAGVSDFGARDLLFGLSLPAIWPEGAGWSDFLFESHAYAAFGMLVVVALHIGMAVQDHMTRSRWDAPEED
ncbi:MAG: cytochrome b/b6 domain-containing protein [Xanthobacteraceae bacterium]|nr:cytochrome b/b6 domain-containing protein [Xanthobacteraceae bacterium]